MRINHIAAGIFLLLACVVFLGARYSRARKRGRFRAWGWAGLAIIAVAEVLLFLRVGWVTTFFTPLVWTGYLLLADSLVARLEGESLLVKSPGGFLTLAF